MPVPTNCFADRLSALVPLQPVERAALARLEERSRTLRRGQALQREHERCGELHILTEGAVMSSVLLDDGSRQILRLMYPGDLMGTSGLIYDRSPETITALSDCTVCPFERATFGALIAAHPRIAALIAVYQQIERVALTDRLAALGRSSAKSRVAALVVEIRNRRRMIDRSVDGGFQLGLTQEEIGDATGLTAVHVNRMLRQLDEEGLIARDAGRVTILDEPALVRAGNYADRYANVDLSWLPAAR